jgi:hypothetical protein
VSINAIDNAGRSHLQRDLKHLVRDVRHEVQSETKELRAAGGSREQIAAVRSAMSDFRDDVQAASRGAGRGKSFDPSGVSEKLSLAVVAFTNALKVVNGPAGGETPPTGESPLPAEDVAAGSVLDVMA